MRGSPLVQFILLTLALAASGLGLVRITSAGSSGNLPESVTTIAKSESVVSRIPYHLLLSAPASLIEIDTGHQVRPSPDASPITGMLELEAGNPRVALIVRWKNPANPGEHRFAKLTLEAPGKETLTHVFDANGDIEDLLELPFSAAR